MNTSPSITVIVIAHNRREFLGEALQSIARQTLDRDRYEVLLVKDFHDSSIDALCDKLAIEPIYTTAASTSGMFLEGFERSRSDVLTFLDDDDRYSPGRLAYILSEFDRDPALGYLHNGLKFIDALGQPLSGGLDLHFRLMALHRRRRVIRDSQKSGCNPRLGTSRPDFNSSSMAVRRSVMDVARPYLGRVNLAVDSLFYCAGWIAPTTVLVDPRKETQYRIHSGNISVASGMQSKDSQARIDRLNRFRQILRKDHATLVEMAATSGRVELERDLRAMDQFDQALEEIRESTLGRDRAGKQLLDFSRYLQPGSVSAGLLQAVACTAVATVSPPLARRVLRWSG